MNPDHHPLVVSVCYIRIAASELHASARFAADIFGLQRVAEKNVGLALITGVVGHNRIERFGESYLLHFETPILPSDGYDKQQRRCEQLSRRTIGSSDADLRP